MNDDSTDIEEVYAIVTPTSRNNGSGPRSLVRYGTKHRAVSTLRNNPGATVFRMTGKWEDVTMELLPGDGKDRPA